MWSQKIQSGLIFVGEGDYKISLYKETIIYYNLTSQPGSSPEYIDSRLQNDEEARRIADEFLDLHNLRPDGAVFYDTTLDVGHFVDPQKGVEIKKHNYSVSTERSFYKNSKIKISVT